MKLLYGTTNPAKLICMKEWLKELEIELIGLSDRKKEQIKVKETGKDPLENARMKAEAYYQAYHIPVFSCDSGLYFKGLKEEFQPGVHVRRINGKHLTDEEMICYYSSLAKRFGGIRAHYQNAICLILNDTTRYESMEKALSGEEFLLVSEPHKKRVEGFPLDSLSVHIPSKQYYYDREEDKEDDSLIAEGFYQFFLNVLEKERIL